MSVSDTDTVNVCCTDEECVEVFLNDPSEPVIICVPGPPGPPAKPSKCGSVPGADFAGSPKKFTVVFTHPYADDSYVITLSGDNSRSFTWETKTASGFVINANAATALTGPVDWFTAKIGETAL